MNNTLHFTDEQFQVQHSDKCDLLLHLGSNSIAYSIIDQNNQLVILRNHPRKNDEHISAINNLDNIRESSDYLQLNFRKIKISLETPEFTFIPQELYSEDLLNDYLQFIKPASGSEAKASAIEKAGLINLTAIDSELTKELKQRFHNPLIVSSIDPYIESTSQIAKESNSSILFLNFQKSAFEAAHYKEGNFIFYNRFEFTTEDEFNYFLLNIIEQLNLDVQHTNIQLTGDIDFNNQLTERISKYFHEISLGEVPHILKESWSLATNEGLHTYFSLLSLSLCE
ncbi:DUF3822 family protein [Daejeonella oryzae]|uniref:DUF3822 family protein n=1 Tax=Daejeonella oryzae TaxID=1122943 RepID=UPI00047C9E2A|nr:DUF3822 family protein [Daejeonella oryzae]